MESTSDQPLEALQGATERLSIQLHALEGREKVTAWTRSIVKHAMTIFRDRCANAAEDETDAAYIPIHD